MKHTEVCFTGSTNRQTCSTFVPLPPPPSQHGVHTSMMIFFSRMMTSERMTPQRRKLVCKG